MRQSILSRKMVAVILFGLLSTGVRAANVGYYEMCDGTGASWAITPIIKAGHTPINLTDLTAADLQGLDVLFVTNCYNLWYPETYLRRLADIEAAVKNGMVLLMHDRLVWRVWDGIQWEASQILPGGGNINFAFHRNTDINIGDPSTLVTNGPAGVLDDTSLDKGLLSSHGYADVNSLPPQATVILTEVNPNRAITFSYPYGKGSVIYGSIPIDVSGSMSPICYRFPPDNKSFCLNLVNIYIPNVVSYAVELKNAKPNAVAGPDLAVDEGASATLDGSGSRGRGALTYEWQQISPVSPQLQFNSSDISPTFSAPQVDANTAFTMQLVVTDERGIASDPDTVDVTVKDVNTPPVADAGDGFRIKAGAGGTLDGSNSYDPDGDSLSYSWQQIAGPAATLTAPQTVNPGFVVPDAIGQQLVFELVVSDGKAQSQASTVTVDIVENAAPVASAGTDQTRNEGQLISLDASASHDPDGDGLIFEWSQSAGPSVTLDNPGSPTPYFTAPHVAAGGSTLTFALKVTDTDALHPKSSVAQVSIHLLNINDPPACHLARPSVASLWPPNHKMRPISIEGVSDTDSIYNKVVITIDSVTSDEPVAGRGSGHYSPDAVILDLEPRDQVLLRAERNKRSNGRVYQVNFTASDGFESCLGSVQVTVPKSRKHENECDDHEDREHGRKDDKKDHRKGHKADDERHDKHCPAPAPVDDGQNYTATDTLGADDDILQKIKKQLAKWLAKWKKEQAKHDEKEHDKDDD